MSSIPQRFYIYTLAYPPEMGGAIFYVGKGQGYRIEQHEREARLALGFNPYKENVIRLSGAGYPCHSYMGRNAPVPFFFLLS